MIGGHAAVGEDEAGHAVRGEVVDEVLHPGEVRVALGRDAVFPAEVVVLAVPVGVVEGRVRQDVIGAEIRVLDVAEGVGMLLPDIRLDPADGEVHDGEAAGGGIAFLPVDGDVPELAAVAFHELFRLDEHAAGAAGGIVDAPLVGGEHLDKAAHHAGGGVELPAVLPLRTGEAGEEILIHPPEQIYRPMAALTPGPSPRGRGEF